MDEDTTKGSGEMAKVALTGGCGLLGRYVSAVVGERHEVKVLDKALSEAELERGNATRLDVLNLNDVYDALSGQDLVIHLAGLDAAVDASEHDFFHVNVQGTWNILHAAERHGIRRVVMASSVSAFGIDDLVANQHPRYLPVDENHPFVATHPYGLSKQVMEVTARSFVRRGKLEVIALRPVLIAFDYLIAPTVDLIERRDVKHEPGYLTATRCYVGPTDAARCFDLALDADTEPFDTFLVSAPRSLSPEPTIDGVRRRFGVSPEIRNPRWFEADPCAAMVDATRATRILGWQATEDWETLVAEAG